MAKGFLEGIGVAETISVAVANGETSATVAVQDRPDANYKVFALGNYDAVAYVTSKTRNGFTLNFADPTADKTIDCLIIS